MFRSPSSPPRHYYCACSLVCFSRVVPGNVPKLKLSDEAPQASGTTTTACTELFDFWRGHACFQAPSLDTAPFAFGKSCQASRRGECVVCGDFGRHAQTSGSASSGSNYTSEEDGGNRVKGLGERFQDSRWKVRLRLFFSQIMT